jgi:hypothetical protein
MNTAVCSLPSIRSLALPVANSTLQERQFYIFLETNQAAKKTGKRRTASEKNSTFTSSNGAERCGGAGAGAGAGASMIPQRIPTRL